MYIPFSPPDMTEREAELVKKTILSGWITSGPKKVKFENNLSEYCGTEKTCALSSATAALELTLRLLEIGPGDEVIVPAYTYTATCSVVCHVGATPIMIDTKRDSYEMDYDLMEEAITEKTKAIIPVDLGGFVCDYDRIFRAVENKKALFKAKGLVQESIKRVAVIADCAHGLGAMRNGVRTGAIADFTSFSFHAVKNLTTAEGGAVTWKKIDSLDSGKIYEAFSLMSLHGQNKSTLSKNKPGAWEYDVIAPFYKCNMTDIAATIGLAQLERYDDMLLRRYQIIEKYNKAFASLNVKLLTYKDENHISSGHLYLVRVNGIDEAKRNLIIEKMAEAEIACNVHYKPLPMLTAYKSLGFKISDYPNAYAQYQNEISLPLYSRLTDEQVDYIIENFKRCVEEVL